jgi:hypothetical protein
MNADNIKANAAPPGLYAYSFRVANVSSCGVHCVSPIPCRKACVGAARRCGISFWPDSGLRFVLALLALTGAFVGLNVDAESAQLAPERSLSEEAVKSTGNPARKQQTGQLHEKGVLTQAVAKPAASKPAVEPEPTEQARGIQHATRHPDGQPLLNAHHKNATPSLPLPPIHTPTANPKEGLSTKMLKPQLSQGNQPARRISVPTADAFHNRNTAPAGIGGPSGITKSREIHTGLNGTEIKRKP